MANQYVNDPFVVVLDPLGIFARGAAFERGDVAATLWTSSWPPGLVLRDTAEQRRYRVAEHRTQRAVHQRLVALAGDVAFVPRKNGGMRKVEA